MSFGKRVAYIREREGLRQKELANMLGITPRKLSDYERDQCAPKDDLKIMIAKVLDISMDYLMGLNEDIVSFSKKNVIVLPKDFPPESAQKAKEYIDLLVRDHKPKP